MHTDRNRAGRGAASLTMADLNAIGAVIANIWLS